MLEGWRVALQAVGAPVDDPHGCQGCQSRWGSSENSLLGNIISASKAGIVFGDGPVYAGRNNQVVANDIKVDVIRPCDYAQAVDTTAIDNHPLSCNENLNDGVVG